MIGIDYKDLITLYEFGRVREEGEAYLPSLPTPTSLAMIRAVIGCDLPSDYIRFAEACPAYTSYFALLGADVSAVGSLNEQHITVIHQFSPAGYVYLAAPKIERRIVFHKHAPEGPIFNIEGPFLDPDTETEIPEEFVEIAPNFRHYLEDFVIHLALGNRAALYGKRFEREFDERENYVMSILDKYST